MAWGSHGTDWSTIDRIKGANMRAVRAELYEALLERFAVQPTPPSNTIVASSELMYPYGSVRRHVYPPTNFRVAFDYLINEWNYYWADPTINSGDFAGLSEIPRLTESRLETIIGSTIPIYQPIAGELFTADDAYWFYQALNLLVWTYGNSSPTDTYQRKTDPYTSWSSTTWAAAYAASDFAPMAWIENVTSPTYIRKTRNACKFSVTKNTTDYAAETDFYMFVDAKNTSGNTGTFDDESIGYTADELNLIDAQSASTVATVTTPEFGRDDTEPFPATTPPANGYGWRGHSNPSWGGAPHVLKWNVDGGFEYVA